MNRNILSLFTIGLVFAGCSQENSPEYSEVDSKITRTGLNIKPKHLSEHRSFGQLSTLTPTGEKIFEAALTWENEQWKYRNDSNVHHRLFATPSPRMCAGNVSQVFYMTGISEFKTEYRWSGVDEVFTSIKSRQGASVHRLPQYKTGIINKLKSIHNGHIPVGSVVGGCKVVNSNNDCRGQMGSRHVGVIGDTIVKSHPSNSDLQLETILAYHNNWYRPDNAGGQHIEPYMVSKRNLNAGFPRQWMATPWLTLTRNKRTSEIVDVKTPLINPHTGEAALDDMDPWLYHVFVAIPSRVQWEINQGYSIKKGTRPTPGGSCQIIQTSSNVRSSPDINNTNIRVALSKGYKVNVRGFWPKNGIKWVSVEFNHSTKGKLGAPAKPSFIAESQLGLCTK